MMPGHEANEFFFSLLDNNGVLSVLIRIASMRTHNIQFHDKIRKFL